MYTLILLMLAVHGAELFGASDPLLQPAKKTYEQVEMPGQWDEQCGGGVYWARNRNDQQANKRLYKSTISNVEQMMLAVRLFLLTKDQNYLNSAVRIYNWLVGPSGIITPDGKVFDGVYVSQCNDIVKSEHSYNPGLFLGGAALLFRATKDQKYIADILRVMGNYEKVFVKNNILIDPCEIDGTCKQNQAQFKGVAIFSLGYLYQYSDDAQIKEKVKTWIETSANAMFNTCTSDFSCSNFWLPETANRPTDVHNQMNALFMSNSLAMIRSARVEGGITKPPPVKLESDKSKPRNSARGIANPTYLFIFLVSAFF